MYISLISSTRNSYHILNKLQFFRRIFEKSSNIKFKENSSSGSRVVPCGRTDGQAWRSQQSLFAVLRKRVNVVKHKCMYTKVTRDVIIQAYINLERLNFVLWGLTFVGPQFGAGFMWAFWELEFWFCLLDYWKICAPLFARKQCV